MKDLFFHSNDLEYIKVLRECEKFHPPFDLSEIEAVKCHPNEFGYFQFPNLRIRLLLGRIMTFKCPWCNSEPEIRYKKIYRSQPIDEYDFYAECPNCGSQGPHKQLTIRDEDLLDYVKEFMKTLYIEKTIGFEPELNQ